MVDRNMKPKLKRSCLKEKDASSGATPENNKVESSNYDPISFTEDPVEIASEEARIGGGLSGLFP